LEALGRAEGEAALDPHRPELEAQVLRLEGVKFGEEADDGARGNSQ
jgi:hypothetical protein